MNKYSINKKKKTDVKKKIINRQINEIEALKRTISDLELDCKKKDSLISTVDVLRNDLEKVVNDLHDKSKKYDNLINELRMMKKVMNQEVFKGRWRLIRWLLR